MKISFFLFLFVLSLSASAQFDKRGRLLKKYRPLVDDSVVYTADLNILPPQILYPTISSYKTSGTADSFEKDEASVIKEAQRNMHYNLYYDASCSFSGLARLYMGKSKFSEAKWYLLQSLSLSKQTHDDKHTISSLIDLSLVKASIGDMDQARQDLNEARGIAITNGLNDELKEIDQISYDINKNKA